jgi:hypothetical protein
MPMQFWLHPPATCPKCLKDTVKLSYIEADNGTATLNYACPTCGMVKAAVYSLKPKGEENTK